jgi:hypothetical protein
VGADSFVLPCTTHLLEGYGVSKMIRNSRLVRIERHMVSR